MVLRYSCSTATDTFDCLVNADPAALESVNNVLAGIGFFGTYDVTPVVDDGTFIVERPLETLQKGKGNGVRALLTGSALRG